MQFLLREQEIDRHNDTEEEVGNKVDQDRNQGRNIGEQADDIIIEIFHQTDEIFKRLRGIGRQFAGRGGNIKKPIPHTHNIHVGSFLQVHVSLNNMRQNQPTKQNDRNDRHQKYDHDRKHTGKAVTLLFVQLAENPFFKKPNDRINQISNCHTVKDRHKNINKIDDLRPNVPKMRERKYAKNTA